MNNIPLNSSVDVDANAGMHASDVGAAEADKNTRSAYLPLEAYLPHRRRMVLLDRILEAEAGRILCAVTIRAESPFCRDEGAGLQVAAHVGIEYMAQAIGVLVGWQARAAGEPVRTGFLVSTRQYTSRVDAFPLGAELRVEARENWRDDTGLGVMDCAIYHPNAVLAAEATLTVFQPKDLQTYLTTP
jgi:predicted hotdog family 3-hydroxylacyl-ACP dehydratase